MNRALFIAALCLIGCAPVGVAVGVAVAVGTGWGIAAGALLCGAVGVWLLSADIVPDQREVSR